jgi:peptidoglycan hydrolase-like protein with peptidoglycan-binding domain
MPGSQRDLGATDPWIASFERSLARRARASRRARGAGSSCALTDQLATLRLQSEARDLAAAELWDLSLGRSRARRRAAELQFVPAATRAKRISIGAVAALAVGPSASIAADGKGAASAAGPAPAGPPTTTEHTLVLSPESEGRQVTLLQRALGDVKVDGVYGPETEAAVRQFQTSRGLAVDGVVGQQTTSALRDRATATATFASFHATTPGETQATPESSAGASALGSEAGSGASEAGSGASEAGASEAATASAVKRLQAALKLPVDGEFGPETFAAIERLQARHGLSVDGVVGPQTWKVIGVSTETMLNPPASAIPPEPEPEPAPTEVAASGGVASGGEPVAVATGAPPAAGAEERPAVATSEAPAESAPVSAPSSSGGGEGSSAGTPSSSSSSSAGSGEGAVGRVIAAGNEIATRPYVYGGGHGSFQSNGYDCSGSVSYALHGAGLINSPEDSSQLESYGESGPGKHITIYANSEHTFMVVNGKRFDTVAQAESGSRWSSSMTSTSGYVVRHPAGQ